MQFSTEGGLVMSNEGTRESICLKSNSRVHRMDTEVGFWGAQNGHEVSLDA